MFVSLPLFRTLRPFLAAALLAVAATAAAAQEKVPPNPWIFDGALPSVLRLDGDIGPGTAAMFEAALATHPGITTLILRGEGASFDDTMAIATRVRDLRMSTRIEAGSYCHFGCGIVFLAGAERRAEGILGVAVIFPNTTNLERAQADLADFIELVRSFNLSAELFSAVVETAAGGMYAFSPHEIARFGVDRPVAEGPAGWNATPYAVFYQQPADNAAKGSPWPSYTTTTAWSVVGGGERPQIQMVADVHDLGLIVTVTISADPPAVGIRGTNVVVAATTPPGFPPGKVTGVIALLSRDHEATAGIGGFDGAVETAPAEFTFHVNDHILSWRQVKTHFSRRWLSFVITFEDGQLAELLIETEGEARAVIDEAYAAWEAEAAPVH